MAAESPISNPVGWCQVQLLGGWRRIGVISGLYAALAVFVMVLLYRLMGDMRLSLAQFAAGALPVITIIQGGMLVFVGSTTLRKAILRDFSSDMISSHRMTPMSGHAAVVGYLTGSTAMLLALAAVNWLLSSILAVLAGPNSDPIVPTAMLVLFGCFSLACWSLAALIALSTRGSMSMVGLMILAVFLANSRVMPIFPGLALTVGYTSVNSVTTSAVAGTLDRSIFVTLASQLALGLIFFLAAGRKFRRDDVPAFTPLLAHALLVVVVLVSAVALGVLRSAPSARFLDFVHDFTNQSIVTLCALAAVALLPVAVGAQRAALWARRKAKDPTRSEPRPAPYLLSALSAGLLTWAVLAIVMRPVFRDLLSPALTGQLLPLGWIPLTFAMALITAAGLLRYAYARMPKAGWILALYVILCWGLPPLLDVSLAAALMRAPDIEPSILFTASPAGCWLLILTGRPGPIVSGIALQAAEMFAALLLARRAAGYSKG